MKKSILFSSIATSCCLLIQASASAGFLFITDGSLALDAKAPPSYAGTASNSYNRWTKEVYATGDRSNDSRCNTLYSQDTSFHASTSAVGNDGTYVAGANSYINGRLMFYNEYESLLNLNASISGAGFSTGKIKIVIELPIPTEAINLQVDSSPWHPETYSASSSYVLRPDTYYAISLDMMSQAWYGGAGCTFDMTVSDIPAPAASALLALAGLVSRRRRA